VLLTLLRGATDGMDPGLARTQDLEGFLKKVTRTRYLRTARGWHAIETFSHDLEKLDTVGRSSALVRTARGAALEPDWQVETLDATWGRYFPDVPADQKATYHYPQPASEAFWRLYCERVDEFD
jgi:hypothetical protein